MKNVNFNVEHQRKGGNPRQWLDDLYTIAHIPEEEENDDDIIYVDDEEFSYEDGESDDYIEYVDCDESFFDEEEDLYLGEGFIPLPMGDDYYETPIVIDEDYELDEHEIDIINGDGNNDDNDVEVVEEKVDEKKEEPEHVKEKEQSKQHKKSKNDIGDILCQSQHIIDALKDIYVSDFNESEGDCGKKHCQNKEEGGLMDDIATKLICDKNYDPSVIELPKQSISLEDETISMDNERLEQSKIAQSIANDYMTNIQSSMSPLEAEELMEEENNMTVLKAFEDDIFGNDLSVVIVPEQEYEEVEDYDYVDGSFDDWSLANAECVY